MGLGAKYEDKAVLAITAGIEYMMADFMEACFDVIEEKKEILKLKYFFPLKNIGTKK